MSQTLMVEKPVSCPGQSWFTIFRQAGHNSPGCRRAQEVQATEATASMDYEEPRREGHRKVATGPARSSWAHSWGREPLCSQTHTTDRRCSKNKREKTQCTRTRKRATGDGQDATTSLTHELEPGNWRHPIPSPVLGMYILPVFPAPRSCPKDTALR